jgi:thiamine-phosphate pyrophosphorylase
MTRRHPLFRSRSRSAPPLPGAWLFSDERLGVPVERLAAHLPPGSGIVLRHDGLAPGARWRLARRLMRIARARRLVVLLAAPPAIARRWAMDGVHLRQPRVDHSRLQKKGAPPRRRGAISGRRYVEPAGDGSPPSRGHTCPLIMRQARRLGLRLSMPVHDGGEARRARRAGADVAFVSPLHATRSHPGAPGLGRKAWLRLARLAGGRAVALGGMTLPRARALRLTAASSGIAPGWAAIDAWSDRETRAAARSGKRQKRNAVPT